MFVPSVVSEPPFLTFAGVLVIEAQVLAATS